MLIHFSVLVAKNVQKQTPIPCQLFNNFRVWSELRSWIKRKREEKQIVHNCGKLNSIRAERNVFVFG